MKITYNAETKTIELEDYRQQPLRLTEVTVEQPKENKDKK